MKKGSQDKSNGQKHQSNKKTKMMMNKKSKDEDNDKEHCSN
jgi:hypothetical protein